MLIGKNGRRFLLSTSLMLDLRGGLWGSVFDLGHHEMRPGDQENVGMGGVRQESLDAFPNRAGCAGVDLTNLKHISKFRR